METITLMQPLLTPEEVARQLNVSERRVYIWLRNGYLPGIKVGKEWRVDSMDLWRFIQRQRRPKKDEGQNA